MRRLVVTIRAGDQGGDPLNVVLVLTLVLNGRGAELRLFERRAAPRSFCCMTGDTA